MELVHELIQSFDSIVDNKDSLMTGVETSEFSHHHWLYLLSTLQSIQVLVPQILKSSKVIREEAELISEEGF